MTEELTPAGRLFRLLNGYYVASAIFTAVDLGVVDALAEGPRDHREVAERTGTPPSALLRLLRVLAAADVLTEHAPGTFALSEVGEHLRTDVPVSLRPVAQLYSWQYGLAASENLRRDIERGEVTFERVNGTGLFPYLAAHPEHGAIFNDAMTFFTEHSAPVTVEAYDFNPFRTVVDVGGGHGMLLVNVLERYPRARGVLFDQPHVAEGARALLAERGLADRCEVVAGDFFESVPEGGDCYVLRRIIHDWDDERSGLILRNCRKAMGPDARLLIVDRVVPDRIEAGPTNLGITEGDLRMMQMLGGKERTEGEFRELLADAGLELTRIVPVGPDWSGARDVSIVATTPA